MLNNVYQCNRIDIQCYSIFVIFRIHAILIPGNNDISAKRERLKMLCFFPIVIEQEYNNHI